MTGRRTYVHLTLLLVVLALGIDLAGRAIAAAGEGQEAARTADRADGEVLFQRDCAVCHGPEGRGTVKAPSLASEGTAVIDYVLRTGRMPIPDPDAEVARGGARRVNGQPVEYSEQEIRDIVAYASQWTTGAPAPAVPDVGVPSQELIREGGELWRRECVACHQLAGQGGVLLADVEVPTVVNASPPVVLDAIRGGPGSMPAFDTDTVSEDDAAAVAAFITTELQHPTDPGGWGIGHLGPFAEGVVIWLVGVPAVLLGAAWIGRRT